MTDAAVLGIEIKTKGADEARRQLESMSKSSSAAEKAVADLARGVGVSSDEMVRRLQNAAKAADDFKRAGNAAGANLADFGRAADGAGRQVSDLTGGVNRFGVSFARAFSAAVITAGIAGAVKALADLKAELLDIENVANLAGLSVERMSAYQQIGRGVGVGGDETSRNLRGIAEKLNEAQNSENSLTRILRANNIAFKDREGAVIGVNQAMEIAAGLMERAKTELDKIDIAKALGLTENWVQILEKGPRALQQSLSEVERLGTGINTEMVEKARAFENAWNQAMANWATYSKSVIYDLGKYIGGLITQAQRLANMAPDQIQDATSRATARGDRANGVYDPATGTWSGPSPNMAPDGSYVSFLPPPPVDRPPQSTISGETNVPRGRARSGGGGGGNEALSSFDRSLRQLEERNALARKELETMGLTTAQREASLALERALNTAKRDGTPITEEQLQKLRAQSEEYGRIQAQLEQTKKLMRELRELTDFARSTVSGLFTDTLSGIQQGKGVWESFAQAAVSALNKISNKLAEMAINGLWEAAFPTSGGGGGLFGALLGGVLGGFGGGDKFAIKAAQGAVIRHGNVVPFAKGGIVSGPTTFPMSGGRTGLMGEAGEEGIFPIRRMSNGDMGVAAANSNRPQSISLTVVVEGANGDQHVIDLVRQGVEAGMSQVQANIVPTVREGLRRGALR